MTPVGNRDPMTSADSIELAVEAGLRYTESGQPGWRRVRRGSGFSYLDESGAPLSRPARERVDELVIPPAWQEVWISPDPRGHIQATGVDKAGRKQYIYHPLWETVRDERKFDRMQGFGDRLPSLRRAVDSDLRRHGLPLERVVALAVAVLDRTMIRIGNKRYADENEAYGLTTLTCDHVQVGPVRVVFDFVGKGGADHRVAFADRRLSTLMSRCHDLSGQTLFSYEDAEGGVQSVTSTDVNAYLTGAMGSSFTAKDFRTWGASALVTEELARGRADTDVESEVRRAIDVTAERLGNTRSVCRDSYVHPGVLDAARTGALRPLWNRARPGRWLDRSESALRLVLAEVPV
jgi:DNA topoisomerase-1